MDLKPFDIVNDEQLTSRPPRRPLIDGLYGQQALVGIVGAYESFKTFVLLDQAMCIATGRDYHGRSVAQGPVVYICPEGGSDGMAGRVEAWKTANDFEGLANVHFIESRVLVSEGSEVRRLLLTIRKLNMPIRAVIIDTVLRNMRGSDNNPGDIGRFIYGCDSIRDATRAAALYAHHTGWNAHRSRGHTALPAAADTEITLKRRRNEVTLTCTKQKDGAHFEPFTLETFASARSLALRSSELAIHLTPNDIHALNVVHSLGGLRWGEWMEATRMARSSLLHSRNHLLVLGYIKQDASGSYVATAAGIKASSKFNGSSSVVQTDGGR